MADDALRDVLDQHWQQLRHVEQLRYSFTNIYVVIVAGLLAVAVREGGPQDEYTAGFLIVLSLVGIIINVKLGLEFYHRMTYVLALANRLGVEKEMGRPLGMYGDDQRSGLALLWPVSRWPKLVLRPSTARTSEFVSPGHWVLFLHVVGLGVSMGWFAATLLDLGFGLAFLGFRLGAGVLVAGVASAFSLSVAYVYTHEKFERIDELVEERVGELSSDSADGNRFEGNVEAQGDDRTGSDEEAEDEESEESDASENDGDDSRGGAGYSKSS
jgi:hypothetical protein